MRIGIAFQTDKTPAEYEALAGLADGYGFDVISVYNDLLFQPALGALILMARATRRAQIGPAALNPYTVHPVEMAGQIAVLDQVSQGRAYLGLARGAWLDRISVDSSRPTQTLREAALVVCHLLARDPTAFDGQVFKLKAGTTLNYTPQRERVPILIGTWGPRTAAMAGEIADEVKIGGSASPGMARRLLPVIRTGERTAGRVPGSVGLCLGAVTVIDDDRDAARAAARREVALYLPVVAPLDPTLDDPEWLARLQSAAVRQDDASTSVLISDAILDRFAFAGDAGDLIRQAEALAGVGVTRIEFGTPHGLQPAAGIRLLGEKVLPHVRRL